jgi:hypothetical protein
MRKALRRGLIALASLAVVAAGGWWGFRAVTGTSPIVKFGSAIWIPVDENSWLLSKPVRMALHRPVAAVAPGPFDWHTVAAGFQTAEVPVMAGDFEVDRILIARIDPAKFRFKIVNDPTASTDLDGWMKRTGAALVVNGSYYGRDGGPATPTVIDGALRGPKTYNAKQGAFVAACKMPTGMPRCAAPIRPSCPIPCWWPRTAAIARRKSPAGSPIAASLPRTITATS